MQGRGDARLAGLAGATQEDIRHFLLLPYHPYRRRQDYDGQDIGERMIERPIKLAVQYGFGSYKGIYSPEGICPTLVSPSRGQPSQIVKVLISEDNNSVRIE